RTLLFKTSNSLPPQLDRPARATLAAIDKRWEDLATWTAIKRAAGPWTDLNLLAAVDLRRDADNAIRARPPNEAIFLGILLRTFVIALVTTVCCLLVGFPLAYLLATLPPGRANLVLFFVLLPFWTSTLVRTLAWFVFLQQEGVLNGLLQT